jgi:hypothetical protein
MIAALITSAVALGMTFMFAVKYKQSNGGTVLPQTGSGLTFAD